MATAVETPEPVAPTTAMVEGICSEQLQNSSRFKESILFWATKLRVASRALETVLQVSNILYPKVMLGRRFGLLFISSMAKIIAWSQRKPRKLYLGEWNKNYTEWEGGKQRRWDQGWDKGKMKDSRHRRQKQLMLFISVSHPSEFRNFCFCLFSGCKRGVHMQKDFVLLFNTSFWELS